MLKFRINILALCCGFLFAGWTQAQVFHNDGDSVYVQAGGLIFVQGGITNDDQGAALGQMFNSGDIQLEGNWSNTSTTNVFQANDPGTVTFLGNNPLQTIGGTAETFFNNLVINKPGVTEVQQLINSAADGVLNLTNDFLNTQTFLFGVTNTAVNAVQRTGPIVPPYTNATTEGYVTSDGAGKLVRNTLPSLVYFYPTGTATRFRPVEIQSSGANGYGARFVDAATPNTANRDASLATINPNWYHKLNRALPAGSPENITIYHDFAADDICDINNVTISEYDGSSWRDLSPTSSTQNASPVLSSTTKSAYPGTYPGTPWVTEDFALAGLFISPGVSSCVFPVEFLDLWASPQQNSILVGWETAAEVNNAGFELERSTDGISYSYQDWIPGNGNSSVTNAYSYDDQKVIRNQVYYYRLKQLDFDGMYSYSNVVNAILLDDGYTFIGNLYPNPSQGAFSLDIGLGDKLSFRAFIVNALGQEVFANEYDLEPGNHTLHFDLGSLAQGPYFLKMRIGGQELSRKVVIW